jgi:segregation and condensation protein B
MADLSHHIEAILFVSGEPVTLKEIAKITDWDTDAVYAALIELRGRYVHSALQILEIAEGYQMSTRAEFAKTVTKYLAPHANRLSKPGLETVTIVAYQQPCTIAEVESIRGVSCDGVMKTLLERELIVETGRKQTPGRPILYGTTGQFLHYFGLGSLDDLPALEEEEQIIENAKQEAQLALYAAGMGTHDDRMGTHDE